MPVYRFLKIHFSYKLVMKQRHISIYSFLLKSRWMLQLSKHDDKQGIDGPYHVFVKVVILYIQFRTFHEMLYLCKGLLAVHFRQSREILTGSGVDGADALAVIMEAHMQFQPFQVAAQVEQVFAFA